jgi:hypothetical protein
MFDFNELSNLYFSNVAGWFSPAVQNNNLLFNSAGAMKKNLLITSTVISLLSLIGCSRFEDTTSVGSQLIQDADPSFLDFDKNFTKLPLDTSIVTNFKSVPEDENSSNFGIHISTSLPVGGRNGEISTAYYQFLPSISNWLSCRNIDTLVDSTNIFSTELILSKSKDSLNSICNYTQDVNLLFAKDSTYKYNRNQSNVDEILKEQNSNILYNQKLDFTKLKLSFSDTSILTKKIREICSFQRKEYNALKTDSARAKFKDILKLPTLNFIIASKRADTNYALMSGAAALKIHYYKGAYKSSSADTLKDTFHLDTLHSHATPQVILISRTIFIGDSLYDSLVVLNDTLYNIPKSALISKLDTILEVHKKGHSTLPHPTVVNNKPIVSAKRVKRNDSTLVIDTTTYVKVTKQINELIDTIVSVSSFNVVQIDSIIDNKTHSEDSTEYICKTTHFKVDTIKQTIDITYDTLTKLDTTITLDTIIMKADSLTIPLLYSNYVMYERKDTLQSRFNLTTNPVSSYGPQRTAVFELNIDSLWKTLAQQPTANKPAFNKILSAAVAIKGSLDSSFIKTRQDSTDTAISVRWFVSENTIYDGIQLHKADKAIGMVDTIKNGKEAVLPIEKNLQEILSRTSVPPSKVYLYLEPTSSKNFNKQVIWSKPSLLTVLTTSHKE